ncbi:MAG: transporter substrate-binding domain-containing protein [Saccharospirillum sp.]|uniref:transporter substrate-binding domain-containing protein n=1 Tax=Saccharospirillum sp. TaxID=2033801 RepID=UPI0034A03B14
MKLKIVLPLLFVVIAVGAGYGYMQFQGSTEIDLEVVRIGVDVPYPPYEFRDANGELTGFEIDLGNATCRRLNIQCEWVVTPWDGIIDGLLAGNYDTIMSSMSINDERKQIVDFSDAYYSTPSVLFTYRTSGIDSDSKGALGSQRIGVIVNTIQHDYLIENYGDVATIMTYETNEDVNAALRSEEVDAVFHDYPHWESEFMIGGNYPILGKARQLGEGVGMAFRPEDDNLRRLFNQGLDSVQSDGTYNRIRKNYLFFDVSVD